MVDRPESPAATVPHQPTASNGGEGLRAALEQCRDQFRFYEREHMAAGKVDKASTNRTFADLADAALTAHQPTLSRVDSLLFLRAISTRMATACDWTKAGKDHVKVRIADWHVLMEIGDRARAAAAALCDGPAVARHDLDCAVLYDDGGDRCTCRSGALDDATQSLVVAARKFWDTRNDGSEESANLDSALEQFGASVPYEDQPDAGAHG